MLFGVLGNQSIEGSRDWRNLSDILKNHEITDDVINVNAWIDLERRLSKNKIIDKHAQKQINGDREHQRKGVVKNC